MLKLSTCCYGEEADGILTRFVNQRLIDLMDDTVYTYWFSQIGDQPEIDEYGNRRHIESYCTIESLMENSDFAKEVSMCFLPDKYPVEKANEAFLELYKLIRARGEYIPELPMEYVLYHIICEEIDYINDLIKDGQPDSDVVFSTVHKIPEPDRSIVLNAMKEPYESDYDHEEGEYNPDFYIDEYEDMKNYLDTCFWDHDCLMLDEMPLDELKDSPIDQWFDMTGFKDSRHYQDVKTGADGEEMVVDVSLDDYPWNLEE